MRDFHPLVTGNESLPVWVEACFQNFYEYNNALEFPLPDFGKQSCFHGVDRAILSLYPPSILSANVFSNVLKQFIELQRTVLGDSRTWINGCVFNMEKDQMCSYAQGCLIPTEEQVLVFGDIHGSLHSLLRCLMRFYWDGMLGDDFLIKSNVRFIFTGDYVDRGRYGAEVLYTVMRLKLANPTRVFLMRGNHETQSLYGNGLAWELFRKFNSSSTSRVIRRINQFVASVFQSLPIAILIGSLDRTGVAHFIQFCHGGIGLYIDRDVGLMRELDLMPLLDCIARQRLYSVCNLFLFGHNVENGLMWNDFCFDGSGLPAFCDNVFIGRQGANLIIGAPLVASYFDVYSRPLMFRLSAIMRGHKHLYGGINRLEFGRRPWGDDSWQPLSGEAVPIEESVSRDRLPVYTFTSAPEGTVTNEDSYGMVSFNGDIGQWWLQPFVFNVLSRHFKSKCRWLVANSELHLFLIKGFCCDSLCESDVLPGHEDELSRYLYHVHR